jgi:patatin-like phospholipase/acyl hydrolase
MLPATATERSGTRPYRVLALDGGGVRGLYSATVLRTIARYYANKRGLEGLDIGKGFDLITGTSTGGILACALAGGVSIDAIVELYRDAGPRIFKDPMPDSSIQLIGWILRNMYRAANKSDVLRAALEERFGDRTLASIYAERRIALCIPAVDMATQRSWVYKTPHSPDYVRDGSFKLVDVCLATSAAPIYLPLAAVTDPDDPLHQRVFADGGLWANNPVLIGLIEALGLARPDQRIEILSVSTCPPPEGSRVNRRKLSWGLFRWRVGTTALKASLESQTWGYHFMAQMLAEHLRLLGKACYVTRLPHSTPSIEQLRHVALDRASPDSIDVLYELGRMDGDMENQFRDAETGGVRTMLNGIFGDMPVLQTS